MAAGLQIELNGTARSVEDLASGATMAALVAALGFRPDRVAVERNGDLVPRSTWAEVFVNDGDKVELVHFVGGGSTALWGV